MNSIIEKEKLEIGVLFSGLDIATQNTHRRVIKAVSFAIRIYDYYKGDLQDIS